jgi:hypothetical protein
METKGEHISEEVAFKDVCSIYTELEKLKKEKQKNYEFSQKEDEETQNLEDLNKFHSEAEKKYDKFFYSFPIIARFIIFSGMFSIECLRQFFKYYFSFKEMPKTYEDFCDRQCEYVYMFNLEIITQMCNRNGGRRLKTEVLEAKAKKQKDDIKNKLVEEYNNFMRLVEEVKVADKDKDAEQMRERLRNMILNKNKEVEEK